MNAAAQALPLRGRGASDLVGNDRLLAGLVLGVMSFWLFAQTVLNIAPVLRADLGLAAGAMNAAVALTSLFAGIFVVVLGGVADRLGRVRVTRVGFGFGMLTLGYAAAIIGAGGAGRRGRGDLQDGVVAGRGLRRRGFCGGVHRPG